MITGQPDEKTLSEWKELWMRYKDGLHPNRKSGRELLTYLQSNYALRERFDPTALDAVSWSVMSNEYLAEKLPAGRQPIPRMFSLENAGKGRKFYLAENQDNEELWGAPSTEILVGVDLASGYYMVQGSTLLWDELCAFQGLDERDLQNYVSTAQYIRALERVGKLTGKA